MAAAVGAVIRAVFILLDLINSSWLGAGLAAVHIAPGAAASLAFAGPVGWIIGGVVTAFFAILYGLFKTKDVARISDRQAILQYAIFGDPTHAGNEQCTFQGNPKCTVVFGGTIIPLNPTSSINANDILSGNSSTNSQNSHQISIPALAPTLE